MTTNQVQPIYILPQETARSTGREAHKNNIMAAKAVAETIRTTLGPMGMDKMLVDSLGDITITNDGVTILQEMQIEHPAAKMIVEVAKTQENEVGDGTTTAVVLSGELLKKAEDLLEMDVHPTVIAKGYLKAQEKALSILNGIAKKLDSSDKDMLLKVASTAMTGKGAEANKDELAKIIVDSVLSVLEEDGTVDLDNIKIEKATGSSVEESKLIDGVIVDKERVHSQMPKELANAKVLLLDASIEVKDTEIDAKISITNPDQMQAFLDMEESMIKRKTDAIIKSGATVVFCQKGIDDLAQHYLAKAGIYACRRVKKSDVEKLAKATGATIISKLEELSASDLGFAGKVVEKKVGLEEFTFVSGCKNPKSVSILVRGGTEHVVDEVKRAIEDSLGDVSSAIECGKIIAGAGAPEIELYRGLKQYAQTLSGRDQLAVNAFAESMEIIPRTLAENAGLDPIDVLAELKAAHEKGQIWAGINVFTGKVMDAFDENVIEPLTIKTQAIKSASEVATMILRIDDVISAGKSKEDMMPPGAGMPPM